MDPQTRFRVQGYAVVASPGRVFRVAVRLCWASRGFRKRSNTSRSQLSECSGTLGTERAWSRGSPVDSLLSPK